MFSALAALRMRKFKHLPSKPSTPEEKLLLTVRLVLLLALGLMLPAPRERGSPVFDTRQEGLHVAECAETRGGGF